MPSALTRPHSTARHLISPWHHGQPKAIFFPFCQQYTRLSLFGAEHKVEEHVWEGKDRYILTCLQRGWLNSVHGMSMGKCTCCAGAVTRLVVETNGCDGQTHDWHWGGEVPHAKTQDSMQVTPWPQCEPSCIVLALPCLGRLAISDGSQWLRRSGSVVN